MNIKGPTSNSRGHTNAFHTDLEAGGLSVNYQNPDKRNLRRCLRCSKDHELANCEQFISDEIQARWDIVKQNKLCHVCLKSGHIRGRCESRIYQRGVRLTEDIDNSRYPHLKDIEIPEVQVKAVFVLIGKDVDYTHEVFEVRMSASPDNRLKALRDPLGYLWLKWLRGTLPPRKSVWTLQTANRICVN